MRSHGRFRSLGDVWPWLSFFPPSCLAMKWELASSPTPSHCDVPSHHGQKSHRVNPPWMQSSETVSWYKLCSATRKPPLATVSVLDRAFYKTITVSSLSPALSLIIYFSGFICSNELAHAVVRGGKFEICRMVNALEIQIWVFSLKFIMQYSWLGGNSRKSRC